MMAESDSGCGREKDAIKKIEVLYWKFFRIQI
jgi:hypothetical protein